MTRMVAVLRHLLRRLRLLVLVLSIPAILLAWKAWSDTMAEPVVQHASYALPGMPEGAEPVTVALLADIHVAGPDMPPSRLALEGLYESAAAGR